VAAKLAAEVVVDKVEVDEVDKVDEVDVADVVDVVAVKMPVKPKPSGRKLIFVNEMWTLSKEGTAGKRLRKQSIMKMCTSMRVTTFPTCLILVHSAMRANASNYSRPFSNPKELHQAKYLMCFLHAWSPAYNTS